MSTDGGQRSTQSGQLLEKERLSQTLPTHGASKFNDYPAITPRFWHGLGVSAWSQLLWRNRFQVSPSRMPMAFMITLFSMFNSTMGAAQRAFYGRKIKETNLVGPPVFVLGHWRSGTTLLHELLSLDTTFCSPNTYQCFVPAHFLLTESWVTKYFNFLVPKKRPMDDMDAGWDKPQEDEFAFLSMNAPTPYFRMAFPNRPPPYMASLSLDELTGADRAKFERSLRHFMKLMTLHSGKRLLLKSPPHTGRVGWLAKWFPGAKFIHITRHPFALFSSTQRLWRTLDEIQGLQAPRHEHLDDYVFAAFTEMYRGFERQRHLLSHEDILDVRYEDLVRDPEAKLEEIYGKLSIGDFEPIRQNVAQYTQARREYKTNKHELDEGLKQAIRVQWAQYFDKYGYN